MANKKESKVYLTKNSSSSIRHTRPAHSNINSIIKNLRKSSLSQISRFKTLQAKIDNKTITPTEWDEWAQLFDERNRSPDSFAHHLTRTPFYIPDLAKPPRLAAVPTFHEQAWDEEPVDVGKATAAVPAKK